ncbi:MAG: hypothetical protein IJD52_01860 [Alphaproteobacteria bacterium]|nr:hypothetical protein [Alphaproteobacteria bacterium]
MKKRLIIPSYLIIVIVTLMIACICFVAHITTQKDKWHEYKCSSYYNSNTKEIMYVTFASKEKSEITKHIKHMKKNSDGVCKRQPFSQYGLMKYIYDALEPDNTKLMTIKFSSQDSYTQIIQKNDITIYFGCIYKNVAFYCSAAEVMFYSCPEDVKTAEILYKQCDKQDIYYVK